LAFSGFNTSDNILGIAAGGYANRYVALPGHSEHGYPPRQAIDFINEEGINGEEIPEEFEALPEYAWLHQHAQRFGFALSYPRDNPHNTVFEPWHWHFTGEAPPQ